MKFKKLLAMMFALAFVAAACSSGSSTSEGSEGDSDSSNSGGESDNSDGGDSGSATYHLITHANPGDGFWDIVKTGGEDAANDLGVVVKYSNDADVQNQAALIATAVGEGSDGIAVSTADLDGLREEIENAIAAGVPVITINGASDINGLGTLTHVGQSEVVAGQGAGVQLEAAGATKVLCIVHEEGNTSLADRCNGVAESVEIEELQVTGTEDVTATQNEIQAKLQADDSFDGILALNPNVAIAAVNAKEGAGSDAILATFDNSGEVSDAIAAGDIVFAIDQQPYLQGYLPMVFFNLQRTNLNVVGGGQPVNTGPGFITQDNVEEVAAKAEAGTR